MGLNPEVWDVIKIVFGGYFVFVLQRMDRNQREIFHRLRRVEMICAANHGLKVGTENEDS